MYEDFNTPNVITYLLELIKELNTLIRQKQDFIDTLDKIKLITDIMGLKYEYNKLSEEDINIYKEWLEYRKNKDFENADKLREKLIEKGIV